jgi:hypothetical protein
MDAVGSLGGDPPIDMSLFRQLNEKFTPLTTKHAVRTVNENLIESVIHFNRLSPRQRARRRMKNGPERAHEDIIWGNSPLGQVVLQVTPGLGLVKVAEYKPPFRVERRIHRQVFTP